MCLLCFLGDLEQYKLRKSCQFKTDRLEHTLDKYKIAFVNEFFKSNDKLCKIHNTEHNIEILKIIKQISKSEISNFFDTIIHSYLDWINAKANTSITNLKNELKKFKILEYKNIENIILFRGRDSKDFLSHWDMFHIPFNKRYLIGNQRYSLVGQPLLYLAATPYCVAQELNFPKDLKISSFRFKDIPNFRFYNNTNELVKLYKNTTSEESLQDSVQDFLPPKIDELDIKRRFFKSILSSCCSFETNSSLKNFSFKEEYIIPQILAQLLKEDGCDGIIYMSTKAYNDKNIIDIYDTNAELIYTNYCFFTKYNYEDSHEINKVYDKELFNKFHISATIDYKEVFEEYYYDLLDTIELLLKLLDYNNEYINSLNDSFFKTIYLYFFELKDKMSTKDEHFKHAIHLQHVYLKNIILTEYNKFIFEEAFNNEHNKN